MKTPMMRLRPLLLAALLALAAPQVSAGTDTGTDTKPARIVTAFHESLLGVMKDAEALGV